MSRRALALQLLVTCLAASFASCAAAGLPPAEPVRSLRSPCATAGLSSRAGRSETVFDFFHLLPVGRSRIGSVFGPDLASVVEPKSGALHGWASQPWHTSLLQQSDSPDREEPDDDAAPATESAIESEAPESEQLEFESYLADPQEAGKKGLESRVAPPWYSAEEDEAVPVGLDKNPEPYRDPVDPGNRASNWVYVPPATTGGGTWGNWSPLAGLPLTELIWVALVIAFVLLGGLLIFALIKARMGDAESGSGEEVAAEEEDPLSVQERIERLPFELRQGVVDFLEEARRLAAAGKYEEALVYLFSHALVQLDRAHRIRLAKGKTNRQYVAEIESNPSLAQLLSELADDFEGVFFGKYPLSQAKYEQNLDRIERFRNLLQQASHG